jgi:cell division protein FtsZ
MSITLQLPKLTDLRPRLLVIGVGGAGCNAINNMIASGLTGVDFIVANTDAQSLAASSAEHRIQLGVNLTEGLGAGSRPEIGQAAAEEAIEDIRAQIAGAHMLFIAAGMGGGTGTGAAAVIARIAKELGVLTVGIVTKPFLFEGARRMRIAEAGVTDLKKYVDTLIVIPNQNLFRVATDKTTFAEAFVLADQVLYSGVACIVDLIIKEGLINLDFADVRTVLAGMGTAMMGTGEASGPRRASLAAEEAIANPLLDDVSLSGARGLLLSISGGQNLTLYEVDEAASRVRQEVDPEANIIVGATFDENLGDRVRVSIVASGMSRAGEVAQPKAVPAPGMVAALPAKPAPAPMPQANIIAPAAPPMVQQKPPVQTAEVSAPPRQPQHHGNWVAPGNVTIEEGFVGFIPQNQPQQPTHPSALQTNSPVYDPSGLEGFQPQPPADVRAARGQRRIPEISDFPAVGQREYQARSSGGTPARDTGNSESKRSGLIGRLTNFAKRAAESENDSSRRNDGRWERVQRDGTTGQETSELPVFFSRERK